MPTNLIPRQATPAKSPPQSLGMRIWYAVLIPAQPLILLGFVVGVVLKEPALCIFCAMLFVSTAIWVTALAIIHGSLRQFPRIYFATWLQVIYYFTQPRAFRRMVVTGLFYVIPAAFRLVVTVPFILVAIVSQTYADKVIVVFWEKELAYFAAHQQRLQRLGL
ncbi:MAG: hypothetical protein EON60_06705 [Alphaproteobacteria bacterium]|nr:MAG: hypothetical protein EON60_06705 [Alphaproteobacteria bacterium]